MNPNEQPSLAALAARCRAGGTAAAVLADTVPNEDTLAALSELPAGALRLHITVSQPDPAVLTGVDKVLACGNVAVELTLGEAWEALLPAAVRLAPHRLHLPPQAPEALRRGTERLYNSGRFARSVAWLAARGEAVAVLAAAGALPAAQSLEAWLAACYADNDWHEALLADRVAAGEAEPTGEARELCRLADTDARYRAPVPEARSAAVTHDGVLLYADRTVRHPLTGACEVRYFTPACLARAHRYLLFDLDGTVTDPAQGIFRSVRHALRYFGVDEPDDRRLRGYIGPPLVQSFSEFHGLSAEQARTALRVYREYYAERGIYECEVYAGMPTLLRAAQRSGYRVLMATSKPEMYACRLMRHEGLAPYFARLVGADMAEQRADKTAVIRHALALEGVSNPAEAVMIGDRCFDMHGGRACGLHTVGVTYGYGSREELVEAGAAAVADSVARLHRLLLPC